MKEVYLDNAATTPLHPEVLEAMLPYYQAYFGNPSSLHNAGRKARSAIEASRKKIAELVNCTPSDIIFTSGGTEANNMAIRGAFEKGITTFISSPIEHHAVLHTVQDLEKKGANLHLVKHDEKGVIDLDHFEELIQNNPDSFISIMHGNNEVGNLNPVTEIKKMAERHGCIYHADTVQTIAHHIFKPDERPDFTVAAAHKFFGPKGVGMLICNGHKARPLITGGSQERDLRGGTENVAGIVGMTKALELALSHLEGQESQLKTLKRYALESLTNAVEGIVFNGKCATLENSMNNVISFSIPRPDLADVLLFSLDLKHIAVSGGSACSSGALQGSHVLNHLKGEDQSPTIRLSFSTLNTQAEIDYFISALCDIIK